MKNQEITTNTLVPKKLRLQLYKKAYTDILGKKRVCDISCTLGLCLSLPVYLWDLTSLYESAPNGEEWGIEDTRKMFPELKKELKRLEVNGIGLFSNQQRIDFLEKILGISQTEKL